MDRPLNLLQSHAFPVFVSIIVHENEDFYDSAAREFFVTPPPLKRDIITSEHPAPPFLIIWY